MGVAGEKVDAMTENGGVRGRSEPAGGTNGVRRDGTSRDELFEVLAHGRRRLSLAYLRTEAGVVPVEELAKHVAAAERPGGETVSASDRKQVVTSLYHVHLPKLVDAGLAVWRDPDERRQVRATTTGQSLPTELSWMPASVARSDE